MKTLMLTAMGSGAGKTVTGCAILAALKKRGVRLSAFKCGPDYIDPMFHERALGVPCRNLDLFLQGEDGVRSTLARAEADFALVEGAMGYYDGLNYTDEASAYRLARLTGTPAVLAVPPQSSALTLAAQICGLLGFRPESGIAALLLTCCPEKRAMVLAPVLERETGLPVLGFLPPMEAARFESRHLGLMTAQEIHGLEARLAALGDAAERYLDLDRLLALGNRLPLEGKLSRPISREAVTDEVEPPVFDRECTDGETDTSSVIRLAGDAGCHLTLKGKAKCRIAVARDEAFCFLYADNLDALRGAGAELVFFSPLHDAALPDADGLYLPGGYPELHARALSENETMRRSIMEAVGRGLPTVAECGGFLYLQQSLEDAEGHSFPQCGALPGHGFKTERLQRFGYLTLRAPLDSLLFRAGEKLPAHEFHYWDSTENGAALCAEKADGRTWRCGFATPSLYAAFPHLHFCGEKPLAERFVKACEQWKASMT